MQPEKTIEIVSEKYGVTGQILDYSLVIKLHFSYEGREHVIGIYRPFQQELSDVGLRIMETTIERLLSKPEGTFLHYWHISSENGVPLLMVSLRDTGSCKILFRFIHHLFSVQKLIPNRRKPSLRQRTRYTAVPCVIADSLYRTNTQICSPITRP